MSEALVIQYLPDLAPAELQVELWATCMAARWKFGSRSVDAPDAVPFWHMDLGDSDAATRLWNHARMRCEAIANRSLAVLRQYANGHTFGQGGRAHPDDLRPGTYTLLYYPMPEWRAEWEGETVFTDERGEVVAAIRPAPNRAIFFDARILHAGRAPSRAFPGLRVTVVWKLADSGLVSG